jgi:ABC-type branched-subunit amino acid transport system substrate-binding protein
VFDINSQELWKMISHRIPRSCLLAALTGAAVLTATACSSSTGAGNAKGSGGKAGGGSTIKLMSIMTTQSSVLGYPEGAAAIQARVSAINDAGGINGHRLSLTICNDQNDPNITTQCAQKAISSGVVAVIGSITLNGDVLTSLLSKAGIAYVTYEPISPGDFNNPTSFDVGGGNAAAWVGGGVQAVKQAGCKKPFALYQDNPGGKQSFEFAEAGVNFAGEKLGYTVIANQNPDVAAAVAQASSYGADCVFLAGTQTILGVAIPVVRQVLPHAKIVAVTSSTSETVLKTLGAKAHGMILSDNIYPYSGTTAPLVQFRAEMKKYAPSQQIDPIAEGSWGGMLVTGKVLERIKGDVTKETFLKQMGTLSNFETGIFPPLTTTTPNPTPGYSRLFAAANFMETVDDTGTVVPLGNDGFTDNTDAIAAYARKSK